MMFHFPPAPGQAHACNPDLKKPFVVALLLLLASSALAQVTLRQGTNFSVDAAADGRLVIDLLGALWIVPPKGGVASAIATGNLPARRPRWSPDAQSILFEARADQGNELWQYDFASRSAHKVSVADFFDQHPDWHPDGERIIYSSDRRATGFDLWELDLPTGLTWRITQLPGDELEPAWSANGRDLVFVHRTTDQWSLMLRRLGRPDRTLLTSATRLSAPAWRPDGSLVTVLRHDAGQMRIDMVILSDPLLVRPLVSGEDFFVAPLAWLNRQSFVYPANGVIRQRNFNSWTSKTLPFRVTVSGAGAVNPATPTLRQLPVTNAPDGRLVLRTARMFDGIGGGYRSNLDIVIEAGLIQAIEPRRERSGEVLVDLGDLTALPGFIDGYAALPKNVHDSLGALLLSFGITTLVSKHDDAVRLDTAWSGKQTPGPRVLRAADIGAADPDAANPPWLVTISGDLASGMQHRATAEQWMAAGTPVLAANWQVALGSGAGMVLGTESLPASPGGRRYADIEVANGDAPMTIVSGLADLNTPGLQALLRARQAAWLDRPTALRRFEHPPELPGTSTSIVLGSKPNRLPPGIALHAEFRALAAAGLSGEQVLRAAGVNAAHELGMGLAVGRLAPGSVADIVIVDGDPLANSQDLLKVVGVVRNGRFFSTIGLLDRVRDAADVE